MMDISSSGSVHHTDDRMMDSPNSSEMIDGEDFNSLEEEYMKVKNKKHHKPKQSIFEELHLPPPEDPLKSDQLSFEFISEIEASTNNGSMDDSSNLHTHSNNSIGGSQFLSYKILGAKGEGTFSKVLKAQSLKTGKFVAIKCMKNTFESADQVHKLREIQALRRLSPHPHIIKLIEVLFDRQTGRLALVFELMDRNLYELIGTRKALLSEDKIKMHMYQILKGVDHMHKNGIFHRDIKPENILMINNHLKLADLGSCRGIYSKPPYTEYISTRWYRAPECILTDGYYNYKMDVWGIGCVFYEVVSLKPLFPGKSEIDQIHKIHHVMGTPPVELLQKFQKHGSSQINFDFPKKDGIGLARLLPRVSIECLDLMKQLLTYNPDERITARQALRHPYFKEIREMEKMKQQEKLPQPRMPEIRSAFEPKPVGILPIISHTNNLYSSSSSIELQPQPQPHFHVSNSKQTQQPHQAPYYLPMAKKPPSDIPTKKSQVQAPIHNNNSNNNHFIMSNGGNNYTNISTNNNATGHHLLNPPNPLFLHKPFVNNSSNNFNLYIPQHVSYQQHNSSHYTNLLPPVYKHQQPQNHNSKPTKPHYVSHSNSNLSYNPYHAVPYKIQQ